MAYYNFKANDSSAKAFYLGELAHGATMDVSAKYEDYANLTADNFLIVPKSDNTSATTQNGMSIDARGWTEIHVDTNNATYTAPTVSYNAANGSLSFSSTIACGGDGYCYNTNAPSFQLIPTYPSSTKGLTAKVYLITDIKEL